MIAVSLIVLGRMLAYPDISSWQGPWA